MIDEGKNVQTTPTRIHCKRSRPLPYSYPNIGSPGSGSLPSTIAPPDHPTILCEHLMFNEGIKSREIKSDCYIARFQWGFNFCLFVYFTEKSPFQLIFIFQLSTLQCSWELQTRGPCTFFDSCLMKAFIIKIQRNKIRSLYSKIYLGF